MPSVHVPENGITFTLAMNDKEINADQVTVDIPQSAMIKGKPALYIKLTTHNSWEDLPRVEQPQEQEKFKLIAPIVKLMEDNDSEVHFEDYIEIKVPHKLKSGDLRFTKVLRGDRGKFRSLPTSIENQDDHEDAYFTVDENFIIIYTKSFSIYTCHKGHKDRLNLRAWVFCSYCPDERDLEIKVVMSDTDPKERLITGRVLNPDTLVLRKNKTIALPTRCLSYKPNDIMVFLLDKNEDWISPVNDLNIRTNLSNIVECSTCTRKPEAPPPDTAFELEPFDPDQTVPEFKGALHIALGPSKLFDKKNSDLTTNLSNKDPNIKALIALVKADDKYGVTSFTLKINPLRGSQAANGINPEMEGDNQTIVDETESCGELTDQHLLALSRKITKVEELRQLAIDGLKMSADPIDQQLYGGNNPGIAEMVINILNKWRRNQDNEETAFSNLRDALKRANMQFYIEQVLNK